jgi:hypothetical protein
MAYKRFFLIELGIMVVLGRKKHILVVYIWKIKLAVNHILFKFKDLLFIDLCLT